MNRIIKAKIPGKRYGFNYLLECNSCHKDFLVKGAYFKQGIGKFCSHSCRTVYRNTTERGEKANNWRGGKIKTSEGYIRAYAPNHPNNRFGYVLEHRLMVEKSIGRYLRNDEIIHHINKTKDDNRIENLAILKPTEHSTHHYPTNMRNVVRDKVTGRFVHK